MEEGLLENKCRETIDQPLNKWVDDLPVVSHRADSSVIAMMFTCFRTWVDFVEWYGWILLASLPWGAAARAVPKDWCMLILCTFMTIDSHYTDSNRPHSHSLIPLLTAGHLFCQEH